MRSSTLTENPAATATPHEDLSSFEIDNAVLHRRDLSKKGDSKRQQDYAERTAGKTVRQLE